jgi:3-dehydroquinate dehydratase/shikimate dehydrogenase
MICVSIAQESRTLALADMLNAAMMGADLLEVRIDCFEKPPNFSEIIAAKRKPIIISCRRPRDGGNCQVDDADRLALLRQAIISQVDYCELELDVADKVPRYGTCQRVISYTNLKETPADIAEIYAEAQTKNPDVIKLVCRARTPEEAWPLVKILSRPPVPTVVVGLGRPGAMLAVLGKRIGAPWTYAALERGSEAYPGQPTIRDLETVYRYRELDKKTRFVAVTGVGEREFVTTAALNAVFAQRSLPLRCLPMQVGEAQVFRSVLDAVKCLGAVIEEEKQADMADVCTFDESATTAGGADVLMNLQGEWHGVSTLGPGLVEALETTLNTALPGDAVEPSTTPLQGRQTLVVGSGPLARLLLPLLKEREAALLITDKSKERAQRQVQRFGGRLLQFEGIYSTSHDVLIVVGDGSPPPDDENDPSLVKPSYLRPGMTVMDLTTLPRWSYLMREAKARGCRVVDPRQVLGGQIRRQASRMLGQEVDADPVWDALNEWLPEEE